MLDETWGLKDGEDKEASKPRLKRTSEPIDDQFSKDFNGKTNRFGQDGIQKVAIAVPKFEIRHSEGPDNTKYPVLPREDNTRGSTFFITEANLQLLIVN